MNSYVQVNYTYDNWGNVTYTKEYSQSNDRVNLTESWMYYLDTNSQPSSAVEWPKPPASQPKLERYSRNLLVGKAVMNYAPTGVGNLNNQTLITYQVYTSLGQPAIVAQWDGTQWLQTKYTYDEVTGDLIKKVDPEGHETLFEYDQYGLPSTVVEKGIIAADGQSKDLITRMGYEYISGWKSWEKNPRGYVTQYEYDSLGRTTKIIAPDDDDQVTWVPDGQPTSFRANNPVTRIEYDDKELYSLVTDPLGRRTKYDFDGLGRLVQLIQYRRVNGGYQPAAVTSLKYDAWDNIIAITDPNGWTTGSEWKYTTRYEYDAMGRNSAIIFPDETETVSDNPRKIMEFNYETNVLTIIDENQNRSYEYQDMQGRPIRVIQYNLGQDITTQFYYDGLGNRVATIDPKGSLTINRYNGLNLLEKVELPAEKFWENGQTVNVSPYQRFVYNKAGHKIKDLISMPGGREQVTEYTVDGLGRVIRTSVHYHEDGEEKTAVTEIYYDENGNKVRLVDANNTPLSKNQQKAFTYNYSATDLVLSETDPAGNRTTYTYDVVGNRLSMTDPRGNSGKYSADFTIIYKYDDLNRLVEGHLPRSRGEEEKPVVRLTYDARGNLIERVEPNGLKTVCTYSPRNFLLTETVIGNGKSYQTVHFYDEVGNEVKVRDPRGYETIKEYDPINRLTKIIYPEGNEEQFEYDQNNNRIAYINGRYFRTEYSYDRYNRLNEVREPEGRFTIYRYDRWGNMTQMINPLGHTTDYFYDELNRLLQEVNAEQQTVIYRYDAVGNLIWSRDRNGTVGEYEYLPNNLLKKVTLTKEDPILGQKTQILAYEYDEAGYRKRAQVDGVVTEYNTNGRIYEPDPYGRIYRETKSFAGKTYAVEYRYDVMGRITGVKYPTGQWVNYEYNTLGELTKVPGFINEPPRYEQGGFLVGLTAANRITTTYEYDRNGRLTTLNYNNQSSELLKGYSLAYDGANNITKKNDDTYVYDSLNQLLFANLKGKFEVDGKAEVQKVGRVLADYTGDGIFDFMVSQLELIELDYAAGSIGVDLLGTFPVTRVALYPNNPTHRVEARHLSLYGSLDGFEYEKIDGWTLEEKENGELELVLPNPVPTRYIKVHCTWDDRDDAFIPVHKGEFINSPQNIIAVYYKVNQRVEEYQYDAAGNRKQETITLRSSTTRNYRYYPNSNKLMTNGKYAFVYDDNGNLVQKGQHFIIEGDTVVFDPEGKDLWIYEYDLLNRLTKVEKDGKVVAEYLYDEAGLRVQKKGPGTTVYYVFDQNGQVLYEEEDGEYMAYVYVLGKHFARVDGELGSEEKQTYFYHTDHLGSTVLVTDESGQAVWSTEYTPFGGITITEGELRKAAKFTGKDLDEDIGLYYFNARWYDAELGRFISEDPARANNNWYIYASNNPLIRIDPTGLADYIFGTSPLKDVPSSIPSETATTPGKVIPFPQQRIQSNDAIGLAGFGVGLLQGFLLHTRDFWNEKGALKDLRPDGSFDDVTPLQIKTWQLMNERGANYLKQTLPPGFVERNGHAWHPDSGYVTFGEAWDIYNSTNSNITINEGSYKGVHVKAPNIPEGSEWERIVLNSFAGGKAEIKTYGEGTKLYRIADKNGAYWSLDPPPKTEFEWRIKMAIKQDFCNNASKLFIITIPEDSSISGLDGVVGSQGMGLYGGGNQIYIDFKAVPEEWITAIPLK